MMKNPMLASATIIFIISVLWLFKLDSFPGVHGDEAWFGIKAIKSNLYKKSDWYGMNNYTGGLQQNILRLQFSIFSINVFSLRVIGVFFNLLGLLIFLYCFTRYFSKFPKRLPFLFFLFVCQSIYLLIYPRIAWEVTSLTFLFISIIFLSIINISFNRHEFFNYYVFLLISLLGSYNHILFASIPLSILISLILFSFYKCSFNVKYICISFFNIFNISFLFLIMKYNFFLLMKDFPLFLFLLFILVLFLEVSFITSLKVNRNISYESKTPFFSKIISFLLFTFLIIFVFFHGKAYFDIITNYKILIHIYSFIPNPFIIILYSLLGFIFLLFFYYELYQSILSPDIFGFFIISYMGIISLFTIDNSPRYYLVFIIISFLFSSYKLSLKKFPNISIPILFISVIISLSQLFNIYINNIYPSKSMIAIIGNIKEPSNHFFPNKALVDYLRENNITELKFENEKYFIEQPLVFFDYIDPWSNSNTFNKATIKYDNIYFKGNYIVDFNSVSSIITTKK